MAVPAFLPATGYGGPVWNIVRLIQALRGASVDSLVLTSTLSAPGRSELQAGPDRVDHDISVQRMAVRVGYRWSPVVRWNPPAQPVDVLHVFGLWNGLSYAAIHWARRAGVPWIWEPSGMLAARGRKAWIKRLSTPYHVGLARSAAGIVWTAPQERAEAHGAFGGIHHWLRANPAPDDVPDPLPSREQARHELDLPAEGPLWGYLGRIAPRKGIERLLESWRRADGPGHLVVTGPVEDPGLERALRDAGRGVVLRAPVTPEQRWPLLRALDSLVLTPDFGENFALVVVEAIAVGTPALVSRAVGAGHWLAGHGAEVLEHSDRDLVLRFREGRLPTGPCSLPEALGIRAIGRQQARIYDEVCRASSSAQRA